MDLGVFFQEYYYAVKPLIFLVIGIVLFSLFVFKFYNYLAKRDVFSLDLKKYSEDKGWFVRVVGGAFLYMIDYLLLIPVFVVFMSAVLTGFLVFLAKNHTAETILISSVALVGAIRATSYFSEDLARDLAKMIPFTLLALFLIDTAYFSFDNSMKLIEGFTGLWVKMLYYLIFVIGLELVMRTVHLLAGMRSRSEKESD
jgi:hypothetical protein